ncbi:hypothetical protein M434DRAFT_30132 [Hypoxylon sp. CO27-5]|nr:hypothetical protein M434DRAFT_30132 [Hypoxylon sp. CO27-5]
MRYVSVLAASFSDRLRSFQSLVDQLSLQSSSYSTMARFFAALLTAVAMLQVGSAAPYPYTNGTVPAAPAAPTASASVNSMVASEVLRRRLRDFPIALHRP